jgi:hypothetical protein
VLALIACLWVYAYGMPFDSPLTQGLAPPSRTTQIIKEFDPRPIGISTPTFNLIINAAYNAWVAGGSNQTSHPPVEAIQAYCNPPQSIKTIRKVVESRAFTYACYERGIPEPNAATKGLTAEQSYLLYILTDPTDKRTLSSKLKVAGVPYGRYRAWLREPVFATHLNRLAGNLLSDHQSDVLTQLVSRATSGDQKAIEYYLGLTGVYDPKRAAVIDINAVLMRVVEVISRHVRDPSVLNAIAAELAGLGVTSGPVNGGAAGVINGPSQLVAGQLVEPPVGPPKVELDPDFDPLLGPAYPANPEPIEPKAVKFNG